MNKIIFAELSYRINGMFFQIQKELGRFCREKQYADRFEELLISSKLNYKRELEINAININSPRGNKVDFMIDNKVIVDLKAKKYITKEDYYQMNRYLEGSDLKLGIIVNFRDSFLKPKRVINNKFDSRHSCQFVD